MHLNENDDTKETLSLHTFIQELKQSICLTFQSLFMHSKHTICFFMRQFLAAAALNLNFFRRFYTDFFLFIEFSKYGNSKRFRRRKSLARCNTNETSRSNHEKSFAGRVSPNNKMNPISFHTRPKNI